MNLSSISENSEVSPGIANDSPVIPMNFSETISPEKRRIYHNILGNHPIRAIGILPELPLDKSLNKICKRAFDITFSFLVLVLLFSWLLPLLALLIKMDSKGPVFFLQKRSGRNNKLFTCVKFRTMIVNAEANIKPAVENDIRITRIGNFLRNYYFDELPQLLNVLKGEMSLIGPRPHMISDDIRYIEEIEFYEFRKKVKPGITGLAQILGFTGPANDIEKMGKRVQLDIIYVRHWSIVMDVKIFFRTIGKFFHF